MNILITGCSFGVPNYFGPPGVPEEHHIEFLLKSLGYTVYNCSLNGGSNLQAIHRTEQFINGESIVHPAYKENQFVCLENIPTKIDLLLWFHTDILRDYYSHCTGTTIDIATDKLANITYQKMANLLKTIDCKIAVVGGCSPINKIMYDYISPDFIIEDWKSEIVNETLPYVQSLGAMSVIENSPDTLDYKNDVLTKHEYILDKLRQSGHFPDGCHPGTYPHKNLSERLDKIIAGWRSGNSPGS